MENILIGIIKSTHNIKLKQQLIAKIILTTCNTQPEKLNLFEYLKNLQAYILNENFTTNTDINIFEYNQQDKCIILNELIKYKLDIVKYSIDVFAKLIHQSQHPQAQIEFDQELLSLNLNNINLFNFLLWFKILLELNYVKNILALFTFINGYMIKIQRVPMPQCIVYVMTLEQQQQKFLQINNNEKLLIELKFCLHILISCLAKYKIKKNEINVKYSVEYFNFYFSVILKFIIKLVNLNEYLFKATILILLDVLKCDYNANNGCLNGNGNGISGGSNGMSNGDEVMVCETSSIERSNSSMESLNSSNDIENDELIKRDHNDTGTGDSTPRSSNGKTHINICLAHLFKSLDMNRTNEFLKYLFLNNYFSDNTEIKNILINLISFSAWPLYDEIDQWCIGFMKLITIINKYFILIDIAENKLDYLLELCESETKSIRKQAINVLAFFLINYQHTPKLFHQACEKLKNLLNKYKLETDLNNFKQICFVCIININLFSGYPEIYKPILDILQVDTAIDTLKDETENFKLKFLLTNFQNDSKIFPISTNDTNSETNFSSCVKLKEHDCGLVNLGNTCYLNCILQALYSCKKFVSDLFDISTSVNEHPTQDEIFIYTLKLIFSQMFLTKRVAIKPIKFYGNCVPQWFQRGQQQDSSEYLIFLMDLFNEEIKQKFKTKLIEDLFGLSIQTECACLNCHTKTTRIDTSFMLPLSFPDTTDQQLDIQSLLGAYFKSEELNEQNGNLYSCQTCNSLQNAQKSLNIQKQSDYLILTLNRFFYSSTSNEHNKILTQLTYNQIINLHLNDGTQVGYELIACVIHSGSSLHHGHYYSYIKQNDSNWLLANDEHLTLITFQTFLSNLNQFKYDTPYILFYKNLSLNSDNNENQIINDKIPEFLKNIFLIDNRTYLNELNSAKLKATQNKMLNKKSSYYNNMFKKGDEDDDDDVNTNGGGGATSHFDGPRFVF